MEAIRKYIDRFFAKTKINTKYEMSFGETKHGMDEVLSVTDANRAFDVVAALFEFGYAKGYRAAMAEMKKGGAV